MCEYSPVKLHFQFKIIPTKQGVFLWSCKYVFIITMPKYGEKVVTEGGYFLSTNRFYMKKRKKKLNIPHFLWTLLRRIEKAFFI